MAYDLNYTPAAAKDLAGLPKADARRIIAKLEAVAANPISAAGVVKLTNREGYRIRSGNWRAVFLLDRGRLVVTVVKVEKRGSVYR
jgi:mRNA interferase RelE/StbE